MSEMFEDIEGVEVVVDDLLIWGTTEEEHDTRGIRHKTGESPPARSAAEPQVEQRQKSDQVEGDQLHWPCPR